MFQFINWLFERFFLVVGAFVGSQIPAYMYQYTQQLKGRLEELHRIVEDMNKLASMTGKTLHEYIHKFLSNSDPDFIHQGELMNRIASRWENLSNSLKLLQESSYLSKPYIFFKEMDVEIAHSTFSFFQPSLTINLEGICYTIMGMAIAFLVYRFIIKSALSLFKSKNSVKLDY